MAGIGKTSAISEWIQHSRADDTFVLSARCDEFTALALDPIRWAIENATPSPGRESARDSRDETLNLLRALPDQASDGPSLEAQLTTFLSAASGGNPAIVVLEDIHVADADTLALTARLGRSSQLPLLVIVSYRPTPGRRSIAFEGFIHRLAETGKAHEIVLPPLTVEGVAQLWERNQHQPGNDALTKRLHRLSGGIPLFAKLAIESHDPAALMTDDRVSSPQWPERVTDALLRKFVAPSSLEAEMCAFLGLFGHFTWDALGALSSVMGLDDSETRRLLTHLVEQSILVRTHRGLDFSHPLIREAFTSLLTPVQRRRMHLARADLLVGPSTAEVDTEVLYECAAHLMAAGSPLSSRQVTTLLAAAQNAMWVTPDPAAQWLEMVRFEESSTPEQSQMALISQLTAMLYAGRSGDAWRVGQQVLSEVPTSQLPPGMTDAITCLAFTVGNYADCIQLVKDTPREQRTLVALANAGTAAVLLGRKDEVMDHYLPVWEAVQRGDDIPPIAALQCLSIAAMLGLRDQVGPFRNLCLELAEDASPVDRALLLATVDVQAPQYSRELSLAPVDAVGRVADVSAAGGREFNVCLFAFLHGQWDTLLETAPAVIESLRTTGNHISMSMPAACSAMVCAERQDWARLQEFVEQAMWPLDILHTPFISLALAKADVAQANVASAEMRLRTCIDTAVEQGVICFLTVPTDYLCLILESEGRQDEAREVIDKVMAMVGPLEVPILDAYGKLTLARLNSSTELAYEAFHVADQSNFPLVRARCQVLLAELGESARTNLRAAHESFKELGAVSERIHCEQVMRDNNVPTPRGRGDSDTLTAVESAVVRELVLGQTNRQIADSLHYSQKTIEMHLSRIYARTGYSGRVELTSAVSAGDVHMAETTPS